MGKGDGKKKRKKKSSSSSSSSASSSPPTTTKSAALTNSMKAASSPLQPLQSQQPQRVSTSINIPIRTQIRYANLKKEFMKASTTSFRQTNVKRTKYRKSLDETDQEAAKILRQKRGQEPDWDVILNATSSSPLVLVDGYNVIYQWGRLKKWMMRGENERNEGLLDVMEDAAVADRTKKGVGNIQRARSLLIRDLEELHNIKGWRIECVFDGFGRSNVGPVGEGPGARGVGHNDKSGSNGEIDVNSESSTNARRQPRQKISALDRKATLTDTGRGVRIVYSGIGASADSYIESKCLDAKSITEGKLAKSTGQLIVVSNDVMIRMVATGAGALVMSSDRLVEELKAVKKITAYRVEAAIAFANGGYIRPEGLRGKNGMAANRMVANKVVGVENAIAADPSGLDGSANGSAAKREVAGKRVTVVNTMRGGQFIIEDKRKKTRRSGKGNGEFLFDVVNGDGTTHLNGDVSHGSKKKVAFEDMVQGTQTLPSWAIVPNATKFSDLRK